MLVLDLKADEMEKTNDFLKTIRVTEFIKKAADVAIANHWLKKKLAELTSPGKDDAPF